MNKKNANVKYNQFSLTNGNDPVLIFKFLIEVKLSQVNLNLNRLIHAQRSICKYYKSMDYDKLQENWLNWQFAYIGHYGY